MSIAYSFVWRNVAGVGPYFASPPHRVTDLYAYMMAHGSPYRILRATRAGDTVPGYDVASGQAAD
jgi:hypothetical protein